MPVHTGLAQPSKNVTTSEIPLFPLRTVLVPGGFLPLQIFEPRYLDMVRDCTSTNRGFGVCAIYEGGEIGSVSAHARIGTLARIRDFNTLENGLLGITTEGHERFRIEKTRVRDNGLMVADVSWLEPVADQPLPEPWFLLARVVEKFMEKLESNYPSYTPGALDSAEWVSWRLTELLPMSIQDRQWLLERDNSPDRLQRLLEILETLNSEA